MPHKLPDESHLVVDVVRLDPEGETLEGVTGEVMDLDEKFVKPVGGVEYSLFAQALGSELLVRGRISQRFDLVCCRCNEVFSHVAEVPDFTTSVELDENTQFADLTDEVRESIILTLPTYPVCREGCKGLCVHCGKNLNEGPCGCAEDSGDSRWGALDALNLK